MSEQEIERIAELVARKLAQPKAKYLNRRQAAEVLGISEATLDRRVRDGSLTPKRLNRRVMFDVSTL
jgi:predicted DNA-binding transcriptional regulator AlpA